MDEKPYLLKSDVLELYISHRSVNSFSFFVSQKVHYLLLKFNMYSVLSSMNRKRCKKTYFRTCVPDEYSNEPAPLRKHAYSNI